MSTIRNLAFKNKEKLVRWRRALHEIPEPSYQERETAAFLSAELRYLGLEVREDVGGTGLTALMSGPVRGPTVAFRAEMDGLPVEEETSLPFRSRNRGYMHACGHDAHMAMVLGIPLLWHQLREKPAGNIQLIFQPAEEKPPSGALGMIAEGALEKTLNSQLRKEIPLRLEMIAGGIAEAFGATSDFSHTAGYPPVTNDAKQTALLRRAADRVCGSDNIKRLKQPLMVADDMAYFLSHIPGCYAFLGAGGDSQVQVYPWHSPRFDINEEAIIIGTALMVQIAWDGLTSTNMLH